MKNKNGGKPSRRRTPRSPTQHGSELDFAVCQILRENIPKDEKARRIFFLLQSYTTPDALGGMTAFEVAVVTVRRQLNGRLPRLLDPEEIPSLVYLAICDAVAKWNPTQGLSFLAYVINGTLNRARPRRNEGCVITFTEFCTRGREDGMDEDRWRVLGTLGTEEEWA